MAHFARIEQLPNSFTNELEWTVQEVIVASNDIPTSDGLLGSNDMHVDAETYIKKMYKHMYPENKNVWKQTSYNNSFRNIFVGRGAVYLETADRFISAQPFASWYLNNQDEWNAPIPTPTIKTYANPLAGQDIVEEGAVTGTEPDTRRYLIWWDEEAYAADNTKGWKASQETANTKSHEWDSNTLQWVVIPE